LKRRDAERTGGQLLKEAGSKVPQLQSVGSWLRPFLFLSSYIPGLLNLLFSSPRRSVSAVFSLYVLNHFAEAFDSGFDFNHVAGDFDVAGFGTDCVDFAEHFLRKEF
jgi:hypothetical protein